MKILKVDMMSLRVFFSNLIFYAPVALLLRTNEGITLSEFFYLEIIFSVSVALFEIPCGFFSDKFGSRTTIITSDIIILLARICLFFANNFLLFAIEGVLEGLSLALKSGAYSAYIYKLYNKDEFAYKLGVIDNFSNIAFLLSTIGFSMFNFYFTIHDLVLITIIMNGISIICSFLLPKIKESNEINKEHSKINFSLIKNFTFNDYIIIFISSVVDIAYILVNFFYVKIIVNLNISTGYMGILIIGYTLLGLFIPIVIKYLDENLYMKNLILFLFLACIFNIFMYLSKDSYFILFIMILLPVILGILVIFLDKFQNEHIENLRQDENRVTILSMYSFVSNILYVIFLLYNAQDSIDVYKGFLGVGFLFFISLFPFLYNQYIKN